MKQRMTRIDEVEETATVHVKEKPVSDTAVVSLADALIEASERPQAEIPPVPPSTAAPAPSPPSQVPSPVAVEPVSPGAAPSPIPEIASADELLTGTSAPRGRGRPPGVKNKPKVEPAALVAGADPQAYHVTADFIFTMATNTLAMTLGPEWQPREITAPDGVTKISEKKMVVDALENYLRDKKIPDLPPGVALCCFCAIYAAPRFAPQHPTRNKLKLAWAFWREKWSRFRRNRRSAKIPPLRVVETPTVETVDNQAE
jgi:hypothetical protein